MAVTVVALAAGMGSRFGGSKQTAGVDEAGQTLLDYSVYDAVRAGFDQVVCVIAPGMDEVFDARVGDRLRRHVNLKYAHQSLAMLPAGFSVPAGRVKPWGTAHAVLCALPYVQGPFVTLNADDYYGPHGYQVMAEFLATPGERHAMVGYHLINTLSEHGTVSRGVCQVASDGRLEGVVEHLAIEAVDGTYRSHDQDTLLQADTFVSLNFWGFRPDAGVVFAERFVDFLANDVPANPLRAEYYLPTVGNLLTDDPGVQVLPSPDRWLGLTYADDLPAVRGRLAQLRADGVYPEELWR